MYDATHVQQAPVTGTNKNNFSQKHYNYAALIIGAILWLLAVIAMIMLSLFAHSHRLPTPFELTTSRDIQHIAFPPFVQATMRWFTAVNDPGPDVFIVPAMVLILALCRKFLEAGFLALSAGIGNGIDALIGDYVQRPRPTPNLIHVDSMLKFNSFPSGHSCHMMVFYGFLLYLSLRKPVRQWKYRWALLPLQIFAVVTILIMGFARIWEGEHWVTDVLGGYLDGAIWMVFFIFLYSWTWHKLRDRRERKAQMAAGAV